MKQQVLVLHKNWYHRPMGRSRDEMLTPGTYKIPQHQPSEIAHRAEKEGYGTIETRDLPETPARPRSRGVKRPDAEDKDLGRAPEDKSALDG
jgi:hypothetical protein